MKGWNTDLTGLTNDNDLPSEVMDYIAFIEGETGVPITVVSVGPDREQTLTRDVMPETSI
jgi:adenylosuccinate synthase